MFFTIVGPLIVGSMLLVAAILLWYLLLEPVSESSWINKAVFVVGMSVFVGSYGFILMGSTFFALITLACIVYVLLGVDNLLLAHKNPSLDVLWYAKSTLYYSDVLDSVRAWISLFTFPVECLMLIAMMLSFAIVDSCKLSF